MSTIEKRAYRRYTYSAPIYYEYHNTNNFYTAMMRNHSMGGMCFETKYAIPKGVEVYIKMKNYAPDAAPPESREGYLAEVRWCNKKNNDTPRYEVGVNYFEPVLY